MNRNLFANFVVSLSFLFVSSELYAQVQTSEVNVTEPPEEYQIGGKIYPQFWKAELKNQKAFVPLAKVISFGIQDYEVIGGGHVHELTIAMEAGVLMRIYALEAPTIVNRAKNPAAKGQSAVESVSGNISPVTNLQTNAVVKHYPATTHLNMMEFRVKSRKEVGSLYKELEQAYIDFQVREVTKRQREEAVRESKAE